jgi:hypothetical protein
MRAGVFDELAQLRFGLSDRPDVRVYELGLNMVNIVIIVIDIWLATGALRR